VASLPIVKAEPLKGPVDAPKGSCAPGTEKSEVESPPEKTLEPRAADVEKLLVRAIRGASVGSSSSSSIVARGGRYLKTSSSSWSYPDLVVPRPNALEKLGSEKDMLLVVLGVPTSLSSVKRDVCIWRE
jgi:hypothetical protein